MDRPASPGSGAAAWRRRGWLLAVLLVALLARILALHPFREARPVYDEGYYLNVAHAIASGQGHTLGYRGDATPGALRPPLHPAFLAASFRLFGDSIVSVWIAQIGASLVTVALVFGICARRFGARAAAVSGLACALSPPLVHYTHFLWAEGLAATLLTAFFWLLDRFDHSGRRSDLALAGVALGLTALTKEMWLYFGIAAIGWLALRERGRWRQLVPAAALFGLALVATVLPWTLRNHRVLGGEFVLVSQVKWFPIAFGNFYPSERWFVGTSTGEERRALMEEARTLPEREREPFWRDVALDLIAREQPWWIFKKLMRGPSALYAVNSQELRFLAQGWIRPGRAEAVALIATDVLGYVLFLLPGIVALWVVPGGRLKPLVVLAILQLTAVHVIASSNPRYYVAILPLFLIYLGPLATGRFDRARVRRWQWVGAAATVGIFLALTLPRSVPFLIDLWSQVAALP